LHTVKVTLNGERYASAKYKRYFRFRADLKQARRQALPSKQRSNEGFCVVFDDPAFIAEGASPDGRDAMRLGQRSE
jgi:hypothetical protein